MLKQFLVLFLRQRFLYKTPWKRIDIMAMPKGHKMSSGYATVKEGMDYRAISQIMSENGFKMNHATARNVLLSAMRSIAEDLLISRGEESSPERVDAVSRSPQFQAGVAGTLSDIISAHEMEEF